MATTVTKTVKSSGGDYTSLSTWEAGEQGDLVTADEVRQAECYGFQDTSPCLIDGSTTDATRYLRVFAAAGAEAQLPYDTSGAAYRLEVTNVTALQVSDQHVEIAGIQAAINSSSSSLRHALYYTAANTGGWCIVDRCVARDLAGGGTGGRSGFTCDTGGSGSTFVCRNCVAIGFVNGTSPSYGFNQLASTTGAIFWYNNTAVGCYNGYKGASMIRAINCVADCTNDGFDTTAAFHAAADYNASVQASDAPGGNSRNSQTFTFVDAGAGDYHLASGDGGAKDFGYNLAGDAAYPFTTDLDGQERPALEVLAPDTLADSLNYSAGAVTDIDEDPDAPDGNWLTWDGNGNTSCRVTFPTPAAAPTVGAGLQEFRVLIRKAGGAGGPDPAWSLALWENGSEVAVLATGTATDALGAHVVRGVWNASSLGTADGSLVECRLQQTSGGTGGTRRGVEVGAVEWNSADGLWDIGADEYAVSAQTVLIGQVTEADAAQAVAWAPKHRLVAQVTETELAQSMAVAPIHRLANQVAEANAAQALTAAKRLAIVQATETQLAQGLTIQKALAIGQAPEASLAQPMTGRKVLAIGQASEAELAQALTVSRIIALAQVSETELAQGVTEGGGLTGTIGQAAETQAAQPMAWAPQYRLLGQATETDLAQGATPAKILTLGQVTESEVAQGFTARKTLGVGQVVEIDLAQGMTGLLAHVILQAAETDTADAMTRQIPPIPIRILRPAARGSLTPAARAHLQPAAPPTLEPVP
jgi:hypothetical protein